MSFDRKTFFDSVRASPFSGSMSQSQVDGMEAILTGWEKFLADQDLRFLAYMLATTFHETSQQMQPIEEYGKGEGQPYGEKDPETGQCYYGRGFVQLTWRDNYARADSEMNWQDADSCEHHADNALELNKAARIMWLGMSEGWFRTDGEGAQTLARYFNDTTDNPYGAREIINGDKATVPSWSNGVPIGNLIKGYHAAFMDALDDAWVDDEALVPEPAPEAEIPSVTADLTVTADVRAQLLVNGVLVWETEAEVA